MVISDRKKKRNIHAWIVIKLCCKYCKESTDNANYLKKMNNIPSSYIIGKICTEDPISVSRKLSLNFHTFFKTVLLKGEVLGTVEHFYWKKEYQACGAPHYHVLLWIKDAPITGRDNPDVVLYRIICVLITVPTPKT